MDWAQMKERCPFAKFVCRAKLPSHRLAFTLRSYSRRCGVADILRDETREVWGVVYELRESELKNLDKDEDFNPGRPDDQNEYTRDLLRMARGRCETAAPRCTLSWPSATQSTLARLRLQKPYCCRRQTVATASPLHSRARVHPNSVNGKACYFIRYRGVCAKCRQTSIA